MKNLDLLIPTQQSGYDHWTWATVTQASPLRIRFDGDTDPLPFEPECLIVKPVLGERVWVQISGRRVIVNGRAGGAAVDATPVGVMQQFLSASPPPGWLVANGGTFSSVVYPELAAMVGDTFGTHSGTTYYLPNMVNRFPLGATTGLGGVGGSSSIAEVNLPSHTHSINHDHASFTSGSESGHTHSINHNHGSTADDGKHVHDIRQGSGGTGTNSSTYAFGNAFVGTSLGALQATQANQPSHSHAIPNFTGTSGASSGHTHSIDIPSFAGTSGAAGSGTAYWQPYLKTAYIIKASPLVIY